MSESLVVLMRPIAYVRADREAPDDDFWGGATSRIELVPEADPTSLSGLTDFSHAEIVFLFDRVTPEQIVTGSRHPRDCLKWPRVGIHAQRAKNRPNRIGTTIVSIVRLEGRSLIVAELDAIDGTPVLDIKPVMREFLPRQPVQQPEWATELMQEYWTAK